MQFKCNVYFLCEVIWILCFVERECCRYGPGRNCGFPCKCTGDNVCDSDTGACLGGSQCQTVPPSGYGWGGPGCRIGNVAYAKTNLAQSGGYLYYTAELAVDGDITPYISNANNESCARPLNHSEPYAWWWVDLGDIFNIQSVTLVNRQTKYGTIPKSWYLDRSTNYDIKIGNTSDRTQQTLCFHQDKPTEEIQPIETMACDNGVMAGQYVSFTRTGGVDPDQAALCEFIVMGYKPIECHPDDCTDDCNSTIGCEKCVAGKMLPDCTQECPDGYWGVNCADTCGICKDGVVCDKVSGSCGDQCVSWYLPQLCTELLTTIAAAGEQQPKDGGPNITAIVVGAVAGLVVIILVVVIAVLVLRNRRNTPSLSGTKPDTHTPGIEKPNPVYENTASGDNGAFKQGEKSMTPNMVKECEPQYAALDETHQTTAKPSPVYQELQ